MAYDDDRENIYGSDSEHDNDKSNREDDRSMSEEDEREMNEWATDSEPDEDEEREDDYDDDDEKVPLDEDVEANRQEEEQQSRSRSARGALACCIFCCCCMVCLAIGLVLGLVVFANKSDDDGSATARSGVVAVESSNEAPVVVPTVEPTMGSPEVMNSGSPTTTPAPQEPTVMPVVRPTMSPTRSPSYEPTTTYAPTEPLPRKATLPAFGDTSIRDQEYSGILYGDDDTILVQNAMVDEEGAIIPGSFNSYGLLAFNLTKLPPWKNFENSLEEKNAKLRLKHIPSTTSNEPTTITLMRLPGSDTDIEYVHYDIFRPKFPRGEQNFVVSPSETDVEVDISDTVFEAIEERRRRLVIAPREENFDILFLWMEATGAGNGEEGVQFQSREAGQGQAAKIEFEFNTGPTVNPTDSPAPTDSPRPSASPTVSFEPTTSPAPTQEPTKGPTWPPTTFPTGHPTHSPKPSIEGTFFPTTSPAPSAAPTVSTRPTRSSPPTMSKPPMASPTTSPNLASQPSDSNPSDGPSDGNPPSESALSDGSENIEPDDNSPTTSPSMSAVPTTTDPPTDFPTFPPPPHILCNICGENSTMTILDGIVEIPNKPVRTCAETKKLAEDGEFTEGQCTIFLKFVAEPCGCDPPPPPPYVCPICGKGKQVTIPYGIVQIPGLQDTDCTTLQEVVIGALDEEQCQQLNPFVQDPCGCEDM